MQVNDIVENSPCKTRTASPSPHRLQRQASRPFLLPPRRYPRLHIESCGFRDAFESFQKSGHRLPRYLTRYRYKGPKRIQRQIWSSLRSLADPEMELINRYDLIKPKNMYGKLVKASKRTPTSSAPISASFTSSRK